MSKVKSWFLSHGDAWAVLFVILIILINIAWISFLVWAIVSVVHALQN